MHTYSLLDLAVITEGSSPGVALRNARALAQHAEALGYKRFWMAEHHNMIGIASAATAVALGFVAEGTQRIRVGAGGVMLPNHAPLVVAEQFGTLAELYPDRIDLGLGRAPGTDGATMKALRRDPRHAADSFPADVEELLHYFEPATDGQRVRAIPGAGTQVPVWLLGSSLYSARLAAELGLSFAFASHFAPAMLDQALAVYRAHFQPSSYLSQPYAVAAINVFAADTDDDAQFLKTSAEQQFVALIRGNPGRLKPPVRSADAIGTPQELAHAQQALSESAVGSVETITAWLSRFLDRTHVDELMVTGQIFDHNARLRSFELAAQALTSLQD
ncbi:MAG: LLM class flavin-dependent oxidoreductase [Natronospirillum sp.]